MGFGWFLFILPPEFLFGAARPGEKGGPDMLTKEAEKEVWRIAGELLEDARRIEKATGITAKELMMRVADEIEELGGRESRYVSGIPRNPLPDGRVLVHNHVKPQPELGLNGFRAWTQNLTDDLEACQCDWAGVDLHGLKHYRVKWLARE